ncbi:unnamed protein product [Rotaria sp. Silwood1]|nr:unnamed protein product [Rotaria sp. Silwood1]
MLSACPSHTIADALFSLKLSRFSAHLEELDNRLLLIVSREYYLQLTSIEQRRQFEQAFFNESNPKNYMLIYLHTFKIQSYHDLGVGVDVVWMC